MNEYGRNFVSRYNGVFIGFILFYIVPDDVETDYTSRFHYISDVVVNN